MRNINPIFGLTLTAMLAAGSASANLPNSAITQMSLPVYGIYTTDDPTCLTNLTATVPLAKTPTDYDFAASPSLGSGKVPAGGIKCVIFVAKMSFSIKWKAGTYTGTTKFGSSTFNDSNCNNGGTETPSGAFGCESGKRSTTIDWPTQIKTDLAALGLTPATDCTSGTAKDILPLYLSTYSKCVGEVTADTAIGGDCVWTTAANLAVNPGEGYRSNTLFQAPTAASDYSHGIHIDAPTAGKKKFKFIVDPSAALGGNGGSSCGAIGPPKFGFKDNE